MTSNIRIVSLVSAIILFIGWGQVDTTAQRKPLRVVTTLNYLSHVTAQIGGDRVSVEALANPRQDPHYVTPTPRMNQLARDADLFIENGLTLDPWAKNVIDASGNPDIQVGNRGHLLATLNVPVKELPLEVSRSWGDIHPQGNPHVWLDPLNVKIIAENIANRLGQLDPANQSFFQQRLSEFKHRIDVLLFGDELLGAVGKSAGEILARRAKSSQLISWLSSKQLEPKLGGLMRKSMALRDLKVISYHKTYVYFADRFGLQIMGELEEKPGIPPPPRHRDYVVDLVERERIKVILNDNFYSHEAADYVASRTSAKVVVTYIDVGATPEIDTYEKLMTYLVEEIAHASQ